ncbi:MAG: HEAT repeat domain-containing protein [Myxococcota bacterium]|nr:HEAT repeat domain-containing protein [Myxococcota bacterium]
MSTPTPTPPSVSTQPTTTLAQVQQAYPGTTADVAAVRVPGVELFALHTERQLPHDAENHPRIVAIVGGLGRPILEGRDVTRAVIKATTDPALLAAVAMAVEQEGGEILTAPKTEDQQLAKVGPPAIVGPALTFWVWTSGVGRMLRFAKVELATGAFEFTTPPATGAGDDRVAKAVKALAGTSLSMHQRAIETLAGACASDPQARAALLDALARHPREETRAVAADAAAACGSVTVDTLIQVLEQDVASTVRWKAAKALGELGDRKAKPALEKAATSSDANVKAAATRALGKLK